MSEIILLLLFILGLWIYFAVDRSRRLRILGEKIDSLEKRINTLTDALTATGICSQGAAPAKQAESASSTATETDPQADSPQERPIADAFAPEPGYASFAADVHQPVAEKIVTGQENESYSGFYAETPQAAAAVPSEKAGSSSKPEEVLPSAKQESPPHDGCLPGETPGQSSPSAAVETTAGAAGPSFAADFPRVAVPEPQISAPEPDSFYAADFSASVPESTVPQEAFASESALQAFATAEGEVDGPLFVPETAAESKQATEPQRDFVGEYIQTIIAFIRGGNIWVAGGVLMLLIGFGFLAQLGVFPIELRIVAAAISGMAMVAGGLYVRHRRPMYALIMQGGGIGVLYLSAFASAKLATLLPPAAALVIMTGLIIPAVALAILQNAQVLALFGFLGGFAAPLLLSENSGNFVALFTCYLLLNLGILAISWLRHWRWLNLAGALATFVVMGYWGMTSYDVSKFSSVEPFLLAFVAIYIAITLISVRKREFSFNEPLDMILGCSVPLIAAIFQWKLAEDIPHGLSISALAFGGFFILLAAGVWRFWGQNYRRLAEYYLANGVILANLSIPLELSRSVTAAVWAVEGAVLFLFACRIRSARIKVVALLLQVVGMGASVWELADSSLKEHTLLSFALVSLAALISAWCHKLDADDPTRERPEALNAWLGNVRLECFLTIVGLAWWYIGSGFEAYKFAATPLSVFFGTVCLTSVVAYFAERYSGIREYRLAYLHVPLITASIYLFRDIGLDFIYRPKAVEYFLRHNFLVGWGLAAWLLFTVSQGMFLYVRRFKEKPALHAWWAGAIALELLLMFTSSGRGAVMDIGLAASWGGLASILPALLYVIALVWWLRRYGGEMSGVFSPDHLSILGGTVPALLFVLLGTWLGLSFLDRGDPAPLPVFIPFLNPLELQQALCIAVFAMWQMAVLRVKEVRFSLPLPKLALLLDVLIFVWLHSMLFRAIYFLTGIPMERAWDYEAFQVLLTALWGIWGMAHLIIGNRKRLRPAWVIGASLIVADTAKLFLVDLADKGTLFRVISFFVMGGIFLLIGWLAPLPPAEKKDEAHEDASVEV